MEAVLGLAGTIIAGMFVIVGVLLKMLLTKMDETKHAAEDTQTAVQPISNGFASETSEKLDELAKCQRATQKDVRAMKSDIRNLQSADDTLLELITQLGRQQT